MSLSIDDLLLLEGKIIQAQSTWQESIILNGVNIPIQKALDMQERAAHMHSVVAAIRNPDLRKDLLLKDVVVNGIETTAICYLDKDSDIIRPMAVLVTLELFPHVLPVGKNTT